MRHSRGLRLESAVVRKPLLAATKTTHACIDAFPFRSLMRNLIAQVLLALKRPVTKRSSRFPVDAPVLKPVGFS